MIKQKNQHIRIVCDNKHIVERRSHLDRMLDNDDIHPRHQQVLHVLQTDVSM
jgi:hypothetical protein